MLTNLREWLKCRRRNKLWQQRELSQAKHLLNLYKQTTLELENLTIEDRENIAALSLDKRVDSLWKLMRNLKNSNLKKIAFSAPDDPDRDLYRGVAMGVSSLITTIKQTETTSKAKRQRKMDQDAGLDMVGW